jgi:hypothetical protein
MALRRSKERLAATRVKRPHFIRFVRAVMRRGYMQDDAGSMFVTAFVNVPEQCRDGSVRGLRKQKDGCPCEGQPSIDSASARGVSRERTRRMFARGGG